MRKAYAKSRLNKKTPEKKSKFSAETKKNIFIFAIIAILAAIPFAMGKYIEFNTPGPFDSASNVYSAKMVLDGAKIGTEHRVSAAMGTLLFNVFGVWIFGFSEFGPKLMQAVVQASALILMFCAMRKLFGKLPAAVSVIIASFYLSAPLIAKFGNVKEQFMIAFMVMGISLLILRQLDGKWWLAVLSGMALAWAPLFKETGLSAIAATGLFIISQPILKHRTWKQTAVDIALLGAGACITIAPLWIIGNNINMSLPYKSIWNTAWNSAMKLLPAKETVEAVKEGASYVERSRSYFGLNKQIPIVMRYYKLLILPIGLALIAIIVRLSKIIFFFFKKPEKTKTSYDRFVLLLAVWWILDTAFVWISPRSYEQYYLPLNASAAMLAGYVFALYSDKLNGSVFKTKWIIAGLAGVVCMIISAQHIYFGIEKSPHSGRDYGEKKRGYAQKLKEVSARKKGKLKAVWEYTGEYIKLYSNENDKIYVWGWVPGVYVKAQRVSSARRPFTSEMHTKTPQRLGKDVEELLEDFKKQPPKFVVDSHKQHFPWDRPPLELWPRTSKGFLPTDTRIVDQYDSSYAKMLHEKIEPDEALRYQAMKPLRDFVMQNYNIVRTFGQFVVFQLKSTNAN